jgi:hypothetical protein
MALWRFLLCLKNFEQGATGVVLTFDDFEHLFHAVGDIKLLGII